MVTVDQDGEVALRGNSNVNILVDGRKNRIDLAKERLEVLKNCNCEEYNELKEIIEGKKQSKY